MKCKAIGGLIRYLTRVIPDGLLLSIAHVRFTWFNKCKRFAGLNFKCKLEVGLIIKNCQLFSGRGTAIRLEKGVLSYSAAQGQEQSFKDYNPGNIPKCGRISGAHSNRAFQKIQGNGRCHGKGIGINRCCSNCYTIKTKITRLTNKKRESPVAHKMFSVMVPCRVG